MSVDTNEFSNNRMCVRVPSIGVDDKKGVESNLTFDEAFVLTGHGKFNTFVLLSCGLVIFSVFVETISLTYVLPSAECDLNLTSKDKGLLSTSSMIGIIASSYFWGYLADTRGRRGVILPTLVLSVICSSASSLSTNVLTLAFLKTLTGVFLSASSATIYAYLGELHQTEYRSKAVAHASIGISIAFIALPGLAWIILPMTWRVTEWGITITSWRAFIMFCSVPSILSVLVILILPESPSYLHTRGHTKEALAVLRRMYAINYGKKDADFPVDTIYEAKSKKLEEPGAQSASYDFIQSVWQQTAPLFTPPLLRCSVISSICLFTVFLLSSGFYVWVADVMNQMLQPEVSRHMTVCEVIRQSVANKLTYNITGNDSESTCETKVAVLVYPIAIFMGLAFAVTYTIIGSVIQRVARNTIYLLSMTGAGLMTCGCAWVPQREATLALLVLLLCSGCAGSLVVSIAVEVFPTNVRAMGVCLLYMVGRLGAVAGSNLVGAFINDQCEVAFGLMGLITIVGSMLLLLWPNTEKIQQTLKDRGMVF